MNWLQKLPNSHRSASGLEWMIWRKLPHVFVIGTLLPLLGLGALHVWTDSSTAADERWLQLVDFFVTGLLIFHWTAVLTVGIGCVIVMLMKGPAYVADGFEVSHSDLPRADVTRE